MIRRSTRSACESDENLNGMDDFHTMSNGKRRRRDQDDDDAKQATGEDPPPKRSRCRDPVGAEDPFVFEPRRSTRRILQESQREYTEKSHPSALFDAELDSDEDFLSQKTYRQEPVSGGGGGRHGRRASRSLSANSPARRQDLYISSRRRRHSSSSRHHDNHVDHDEQEAEGDDEDDDGVLAEEEGVRRSRRQRHLHFDSLNMSFISREVLKNDEEESRRQRRSRVKQEEEEEDDNEEEEEEEGEEEEESSGMELVEVERRRPGLRPRMIKVPRQRESDDQQEEVVEEEEEGGNDGEEGEENLPTQRSYFLRKKKPVVQRYQAPPAVTQLRRGHRDAQYSNDSPVRHHRHSQYRSGGHGLSIRSPAKKRSSSRRHHRVHNDSSSTSSSGSSDDEGRFERRKSRSMRKARDRCLPMNFTEGDLRTHGVARDRVRIGASLADIDPMSLDRTVTFDSVGGLHREVNSLKEMVVFPLLYPEVFSQFGMQPPRGVLFHGPPGTGKTLVARALANECGSLTSGQQRVAFFMRKGADCLSKWVGESERQLRLLFDQAYNMRPSIIFFDEIDGLAPVRSTRQDQIHSSIVSTLLALMDGLDSRGEVVVIGATNRIDAIDPALRRPGRFDREFRFPLPDREARRNILKIHTKSWNPPLSDEFLTTLADRTVGYCGADVKALCSEVALCALRRTYPQIYSAREKLLLDMSKIRLEAGDFASALGIVIPTTVRSHASPSWPLKPHITPLLQAALQQARELTESVFPSCRDLPCTTAGNADRVTSTLHLDTNVSSLSGIPVYASTGDGATSGSTASGTAATVGGLPSFSMPCRPRLLFCGTPGSGLCDHVVPALLHALERLPVHTLNMSTLYSVTAHSPEEACAQVIREASRTSPCILFLPRLHLWWSSLSSTVHATINAQISSIPPSTPLLLLGTVEKETTAPLDDDIREMFTTQFTAGSRQQPLATYEQGGTHTPFLVSPDKRTANLCLCPSADERSAFFKPMLVSWLARPLPRVVTSTQGESTPPTLPVAPPPEPRQLSVKEQEALVEDEENYLRELRIFLRDCTTKLLMERKFKAFCKPVDLDEAPDYLEIIKDPIDLETIMQRIDAHRYTSGCAWLKDIELIVANCIEYNPATHPRGKALRHRAFSLKDMAASLIDLEMEKEFEERCVEIEESRRKRGYVAKVPNITSRLIQESQERQQDQHQQQQPRSGSSGDCNHSVRRSLRVHGIQPDDPVEILKILGTPTKNGRNSPTDDRPAKQVCSSNDSADPVHSDNGIDDVQGPASSIQTASESDSSPGSRKVSLLPDGDNSSDLGKPSPGPVDTSVSVDATDSGVGCDMTASCNRSPVDDTLHSSTTVDKSDDKSLSAALQNESLMDVSPVGRPQSQDQDREKGRSTNRRLAFSMTLSGGSVRDKPVSPANGSEQQMELSVSPCTSGGDPAVISDCAESPSPTEGLLSLEAVDNALSDLVTSTVSLSVGQLEGVHASLSQIVQDLVRQTPPPSPENVIEALMCFSSQLARWK